jgi:hypothetical protein
MDTFNQRPFVFWILVFTLLMVSKAYALHMMKTIHFHKGAMMMNRITPCILVLMLLIVLVKTPLYGRS